MNKRRGPPIDAKGWALIAYFIAKKLAVNGRPIEDSEIPDLSGWAQLSVDDCVRTAGLVAQQEKHPLTNGARRQIARATGKAERTVSNVLEAWRQLFAQDASLASEKREAVLSGIARFIAEESIKD